jgi:cytochrome c oxidase subunit 3
LSADHHNSVLKHHFDNLEQQHSSERLGMWMFLATEVMFFAGLFVAFTAYRMWYPAEFEFASSFMNVTYASVNTLLLITSSLTMTLAIRAAQLGDKGSLYRNLLLTAALGTAFMVVKGFEYSHDVHEHILPGKHFGGEIKKQAEERGLSTARVQLFLVFYFVMTAIHGVHLVIGIGCVLWLVLETYRDKIPPDNASTVEVVSLYWHLVDAIWLFLMPLLYLTGAGLAKSAGH